MVEFSKLQPKVLEIAAEVQSLILQIFPDAEITSDEDYAYVKTLKPKPTKKKS